MSAAAPDPHAEALLALREDRWLAHKVLFAHRHPDESPPAHRDLVGCIYAPHPRQSIEGFRGFAKSTYLEEAALVRAAFREFRYMVIVGASYGRACERLEAIKREIEINPVYQQLFGNLKGNIWREDRIVLANAVCIQALGRDQSMLGMKYLDTRPDAAMIDDVEDPDEVRTDLDREGTWQWLIKTFLPSLAHPLHSWVRALGTRRGNGSLPERLEKAGWPTRKFPIEHLDPETGERRATWPTKFPLEVIDALRNTTYRGDLQTWAQEFMCEPTSIADRVFSPADIVVEQRTPTWHATYAMIDPARTTNRNSATTGWAVWSWIGPRLVVWGAGAETLKPDEIIELAFTIHDAYDPVWIGVEEDGLNEWLKQPLRTEMVKRRVSLPFRPVRAPKGKIQFIGSLQPYFAAREVIFARELPELRSQLLSYPTGKIDAPNALAYATLLRPAAPIYDGFSPDHIARDLALLPARPVYLAVNATRSLVTAALVQFADDRLRIYADWCEEGPADEVAAAIHAEAQAWGDTARELRATSTRDFAELLKNPVARVHHARQPVRWIAPPWHRDRWNNVGLLQAAARVPVQAVTGTEPGIGRVELRARFARNPVPAPGVLVDENARWTLRALAGGYSRAVDKKGGLADEAEDGQYRVLMEGIEAFAGMVSRQSDDDDDDAGPNWATDKRGRRYLSALPAR